MIRQITFVCTEDTYGMPIPRIPDGSPIILVQDGKATVGRYIEPRPPEEPSPSFIHPLNTADLASDALRAVLAIYPDTDLSGPSVVFTCPEDITRRAVWEQTN